MAKKIFTDESLTSFVAEIKSYTDNTSADKLSEAKVYADEKVAGLATVATSGKYSDLSGTPSAAGTSLGLVKSGGDVTISSGVITVKDDSHNHTIANVDNLQETLNGMATKSEGVFYIEGTGTTDATAKTSTWSGTSDRITEYYDGLTIRYKIGIAGQSTVTLNINELGAKTVYRFNTTKLTTQFPVGSIITLIYHADLNGGCWVTNDYDANTNTYQRVYESSSKNVEYPITSRYYTTTGSTYYAEYGRYSEGVTLNPSTNTVTATTFKGDLSGNASSATTLVGLTATVDELNKMDGVTATTAELNYVDGVTSNIQTQLDGKQATITGGASTIASSNLTANRALISNGSGKVAVSAVTSTELGYLDGVTSAIQTQLDGKAASSHNHAASNITSGTLSSDRLPTVPIAKGGTGATTADDALTNLGITATATEINKLDGLTATTAELNYVDGVTSNIQTQLDSKASSTHTHSDYAAASHTHNYAGSSSAGGAATSAEKLGSDTLGSVTTPIYLSSGTATQCSSYAGGTAVTLNGTIKAASTASFYAPTSAGISGQILKSSGSGAPTWITLNTATTSTNGLMAATDKTKLDSTPTFSFSDGVLTITQAT